MIHYACVLPLTPAKRALMDDVATALGADHSTVLGLRGLVPETLVQITLDVRMQLIPTRTCEAAALARYFYHFRPLPMRTRLYRGLFSTTYS